MKGLTHYLLGIAVASFFSNLVQLTWEYKSIVLLLAGFFALLPDTIDFRIARFMQRHDYEVYLDPKKFDVDHVADVVKEAIERSKSENREINVKFHTVKVGPDKWMSYIITFNEDSIEVSTGPIVSTGKEVISRETEGLRTKRKISTKLIYEYDKNVVVDILSGPDISFVPDEEGVRGVFIPWHRKWSHSITAALFAGIIGLCIGIALFGFGTLSYSVGLMCFLAYLSHIVSDQFGVMGSNLFPPITKKRLAGLKLTRSMSVGANIFTNYVSFIITLWNFNVFGPERVFDSHWNNLLGLFPNTNFIMWYLIGLANMIIYFILPPALIYILITRITLRKEGLKGEDEEKSEIEESGNI